VALSGEFLHYWLVKMNVKHLSVSVEFTTFFVNVFFEWFTQVSFTPLLLVANSIVRSFTSSINTARLSKEPGADITKSKMNFVF